MHCRSTTGLLDVVGRCISINESLYLATESCRCPLLAGPSNGVAPRGVGAWDMRNKALASRGGCARPVAVGVADVDLWLSEGGRQFGLRFDSACPWGLLTGIASVAVIAGVTHQRSLLGRLLGTPVLNWVGTRSYGLYLYHWPIYQILRGEAGKPLSVSQFVVAMILTIPITEASYRYIELPIRQGRIAEVLHDRRRRTAESTDGGGELSGHRRWRSVSWVSQVSASRWHRTSASGR